MPGPRRGRRNVNDTKRQKDGGWISVASFRGDVAFRSSNVLKRGPSRCAALLKKGVYPGHGRGIPSSS